RSGSGWRRRPRGERGNEHLRRWRTIAQRAMRAYPIVMAAPAFDNDPGFVERVEDLAVEQFVPESGIEAFDVAVLPGAARRDVGGLGTDGGDPLLHGLGD